jgi:UDP-glucose 4-epimerase
VGKPVLITGGEGFIGKHVCQLLDARGIKYDTLDRSGFPTYKVDVSGELDWLPRQYSRVIHLAGVLGTHELFDNTRQAIDVNIHGTLSVLNLCKRLEIPFTGITMDHVWVNPYETTKLAAERLARAWSREYGFPVNYVTVYNAYGEYQAVGEGHPQKIVPTFARAAWERKPMPIWGDGDQVVDLIYAGDVARLLVDRILGVDGGYGIPFTVNEVAEMVWSLINPGTPAKVRYLPMRRGEHTPQRDPVARNPVAWAKDMNDTLKRTVHWYRDRPQYP